MQVLETPAQRYDRLLLGGILAFTGDGLAQWCFACRTQVVQPHPPEITHEAIDSLADSYMRHCGECFLQRHGQRL
ncbi:MAG: hypothetical protein JWR33_84 [Naasia sp.]|jgi:hypothetical protein|uniref:hypothetical protein n=1 Tax=Naasia sp. TaxID=2546198 RepID=UPI00262DFDA9|nr:hypothetical protein [Naasia sp.]MCU1569343.1 hypothetical protein [Naasia sp.]